jgi:hypothetical protein
MLLKCLKRSKLYKDEDGIIFNVKLNNNFELVKVKINI